MPVGLAADHQVVAFLEVLQARGQGAVRHLDAEELQVLFVVRAGDAVGAHQRATAFGFQADHHELTVFETQARITGGLEAEQGVVPVMNAQDALGVQVAHR
ncbi:hypothetical protein Q3H58_004566 [Pseudomonas psychrotolerans]|nr:hypothetical protein [Pseudomonas psychrotolerans]